MGKQLVTKYQKVFLIWSNLQSLFYHAKASSNPSKNYYKICHQNNARFSQWTHFSNLFKSLGFKKNILTVLLSHDLVYDASNNTPAIVKGQINLGSKFGWFELLSTKNNMPWGIFHIESGDVTKLQNVWSCQESLNSPPENQYFIILCD